MLLCLVAVAARAVVFRTQAAEDVSRLADICGAYDGDLKVELDAELERNAFVVETGGVSVAASGKEELKAVIDITERLEEAPAELLDVVEALKQRTSSLLDDLKSGACSFAVFFTKDAEHVKSLKGIEETSGMHYFISSDEEMAEKLGVPFPSVYAYNASDKTVLSLPFHERFASLHAAMTAPAFSKITPASIRMLHNLTQSIVYVIARRDAYRVVKYQLGPGMKKYSSEVKFVYFAPEEIASLVKLIGAQDEDYPLLLSMSKEHKFLVRRVSAENFDESFEKLRSKTAELVRFSAAIPEDNAKRAVKVVNTDTVETIVASQERDRLLAFTSPSCGYCAQLQPVLEQMASMFVERGVDIYVGEYNVVANENFRHADITGVPALFYIKKDSSELHKLPVEARTLKALVEYVAREGVSAAVAPEDYADAPPAAPAEPATGFNVDSEDLESSGSIEVTDEVEPEVLAAEEALASSKAAEDAASASKGVEKEVL